MPRADLHQTALDAVEPHAPLGERAQATPIDRVTPIAGAVDGRRGRVLVVDDDVMIGKVVHRVLAAEHDVTVLTSGRDALDLIAAGARFDVVLCDLMMPVVTGMDVHAQLVDTAPDQAAQVVFLTGGAFTAEARAFLDGVTNTRLEKPFSTQDLRALVNDRVC